MWACMCNPRGFNALGSGWGGDSSGSSETLPLHLQSLPLQCYSIKEQSNTKYPQKV